MPRWHQPQVLHAPCLSFPTGQMALAWSLWAELRHSAWLSHHQPGATAGPGPACPVPWPGLPCRKGVVLTQPAHMGAAPAGTAPLPSVEEAVRMRQQWQSRAVSPGLPGRHAHSSLVPGRTCPSCSLLSGEYPGGQAELPHSLFWAAFPPPLSPRVPHSYCLCRNSAAVNPPLPTGTALVLPCLLPISSQSCVWCATSLPKVLGVCYSLTRARRGTGSQTPVPTAIPARHREAHPHGDPGWRGQEAPTSVPPGHQAGAGQGLVTLTPRGHRGEKPV